uniref:Transposase-associated domain-containing protein n=1 Tax=Chenopodium quinoa TaxID=63459 RepID=A0A803N3Z7_CHEQI
MAPSKDWMAIEDYVNDPSYGEGVDNFLDYAFQNVKTHTIRCPCYKCINGESGDREKVREHLLVYGILKRAHPKASIAEGYLVEECMNLCSRYMHNVETRFNRLDRNYENVQGNVDALPIFSHPGRALGADTIRDLEKSELDEAHIYILKNCDEDVFTDESIDAYKEHVLNHMRELWTNWRSDLLRYNVTKKKITLAAAYKGKHPNGVEENDWKWLIKEVYLDDDFQENPQN